MGELLDRNFQKELLAALSDVYPNELQLSKSYDIDSGQVRVNLKYLEEHGLIECRWRRNSSSIGFQPLLARITANGLDFIADDGGLGAILGVVTVKLHEDTVRSLLIKHVESSVGDATVKAKVIEKIKDLPADGVKMAAEELIKAGLAKTPEIIPWLLATLKAFMD